MVKQYLQIKVIAVIFDQLVPDKFAADPVIAGLNALRAADHMPHKEAGHLTGQAFEPLELCLPEDAEDQIIAFLYFGQQFVDLRGMRLQIVVHPDDIIAGRIAQASQNRVELSEVEGKVHTFYKIVFLAERSDLFKSSVL